MATTPCDARLRLGVLYELRSVMFEMVTGMRSYSLTTLLMRPFNIGTTRVKVYQKVVLACRDTMVLEPVSHFNLTIKRSHIAQQYES